MTDQHPPKRVKLSKAAKAALAYRKKLEAEYVLIFVVVGDDDDDDDDDDCGTVVGCWVT